MTLKTGEATTGLAGYIGKFDSKKVGRTTCLCLTMYNCIIILLHLSSAPMTGNSTDGKGGSIELIAGSSAETTVYWRSLIEGVDGPHVSLKAGDAISP